jgi:hypothetical protein
MTTADVVEVDLMTGKPVLAQEKKPRKKKAVAEDKPRYCTDKADREKAMTPFELVCMYWDRNTQTCERQIFGECTYWKSVKRKYKKEA